MEKGRLVSFTGIEKGQEREKMAFFFPFFLLFFQKGGINKKDTNRFH